MTRPFRALAVVLVVLLAGQFLVGMFTNLYAPIPPAIPTSTTGSALPPAGRSCTARPNSRSTSPRASRSAFARLR